MERPALGTKPDGRFGEAPGTVPKPPCNRRYLDFGIAVLAAYVRGGLRAEDRSAGECATEGDRSEVVVVGGR